MAKKQDTYGPPKIIVEGHITARVFHPILTAEERERRMDAIKRAATRIILYGKKDG